MIDNEATICRSSFTSWVLSDARLVHILQRSSHSTTLRKREIQLNVMPLNASYLSTNGMSCVVIGYTVSNLTTKDMNFETWFVRGQSAALSSQMAQYVFLNVPAISSTAWHPFSISSGPNEPFTTHHIKAQGADQWTSRLLSLAKTLSAEDLPNLIRTVFPYLSIDTRRSHSLQAVLA